MKTITVRSEGVVLDALLAAEFGPALGRKLVASTLELNPGLAELGVSLPIGTVVTLPEAPLSAGPSSPQAVSIDGT